MSATATPASTAKAVATITPTPTHTIWLTRDSDGEGLGNVIDVWFEPPERCNLPGGGAMWLGRDGVGVECRELSCTLEYAQSKYRTLPETDREMIKIG